jgi:hypothetical protein
MQEAQIKDEVRRRQQAEREAERKRKAKEAIKQGKKPFFLKAGKKFAAFEVSVRVHICLKTKECPLWRKQNRREVREFLLQHRRDDTSCAKVRFRTWP